MRCKKCNSAECGEKTPDGKRNPEHFSRRHVTRIPLEEYRSKKEGKLDRQSRAERARIEAAASRTPEEQMARLDKRFGEGQGAQRERKKLAQKMVRMRAKPEKGEDKRERRRRGTKESKRPS